MNEKELLSQLHNFRDIKPENSWKDSNREILLSQISNSQSIEKVSFFDVLKNYLSLDFVFQPTGVMVMLFFVLAGSAAASIKAAQDTKPGDSLYIAKIISEKTRESITFDENERAKLGVEFAANRAKEIVEVAQDEKNEEKKNENIEKLTKDFKEEVKVAKTRISKISRKKINDIDNKKNNGMAGGNGSSNISNGSAGGGNEDVFSAGSGKSENNLKISDAPGGYSNMSVQAIEEAEKLFEKKDYGGAINKLSEAADNVEKGLDENINKAEVKGEKIGTTTKR